MKLQTELVAVGTLSEDVVKDLSGEFACFTVGERVITVIGLTRPEAQELCAGLYRGFTLSFEREASASGNLLDGE